jgi:hypothetical protein
MATLDVEKWDTLTQIGNHRKWLSGYIQPVLTKQAATFMIRHQ